MHPKNNRCWGLTSQFRRCGRVGDWKLFCHDHRFIPIIVIGFLIFTGIPTVFKYINIVDIEKEKLLKAQKPSCALEFTNLNATTIAVRNTSTVVVQQPKYWVILFNLDTGEMERNQPLPIPANTGDFIKQGNRWGTNSMLSLPQVKSRFKKGDRLLGSAYVTCPECITRSYVVYIKVGENGWYAELLDDEGQKLIIDRKNEETIDNSIKKIEDQISIERRVKIQQ